MDFHTLTRRELQSLCKLNKIPANITNVAMADALQSLQIVVGIEEFLSVSQSETADVVESVETVEVSSPKAPQTRCRTSTRQKAKPAETESLQSTITRSTRWGSKQLPREVEESKNDPLKTPAVSRTSRKAPATSTHRNVNTRLSECEMEAKEECLVQNKYTTRRSIRLTEKKSAAPRAKKGVEKAVKIDSYLDQGTSNEEVEDICSAFEKLDVVVMEEKDDDCGEANNLKQESDESPKPCEDGDLEDNLKISEMKTDDMEPESDGISSPFEEATHKSEDNLEISEVKNDDVKSESDSISSPSEEATHKCGEEDEDCDEVDNLKQDLEDDLKNSEVKNDKVYDLKPNSDDISSPCEDSHMMQKLDLGDNFLIDMKEHSPVIVQEEHSDSDDTLSPCEDENLEVKEDNSVMDQEENCDCLESGVDAALGHEDTPCADSEMNNQLAETNDSTTMEMEEMSESTVDDTVDAIPTIDYHSMTEEVEDLKPELFAEDNVNENPDTVDETVDAIPTIDDHSTMTEEVEDVKPKLSTENNVNEKSYADSGSAQNSFILTDVTGHLTNVTLIKKTTPFKSMTEEVEDHNPVFFTKNIVNEKSDADLGPTQNPFKNMLSVVSDDKENIVDEGRNRKKEKDEKEKKMDLNKISIRQLKKQLKALTLKSLNPKEEVAAAAAGTRPALQALCENQMVVGGESEN